MYKIIVYEKGRSKSRTIRDLDELTTYLRSVVDWQTMTTVKITIKR